MILGSLLFGVLVWGMGVIVYNTTRHFLNQLAVDHQNRLVSLIEKTKRFDD